PPPGQFLIAVVNRRVGQRRERVLVRPVAGREQNAIELDREIHLKGRNDQGALRSIGSHSAVSFVKRPQPVSSGRRASPRGAFRRSESLFRYPCQTAWRKARISGMNLRPDAWNSKP